MSRSHRLPTLLALAAAMALTALLLVTGCSSAAAPIAPVDDSKALSGVAWKVTEIGGVPAIQQTEVTANFDAGKLTGSGGVNRYNATYTTQPGNKITISQPASTLMAGPPAAMAQETAYFAALGKATTFSVTADALALTDDSGKALVKYTATKPITLEGTEWDATMYNNGKEALVSLAPSSTITANFQADKTLLGNASVNTYSTTYTAADGSMTIDPKIVTTKVAGPPEFMTQETAYLAALPKVATYLIDGDELWLRDASGAAQAVYRAKK